MGLFSSIAGIFGAASKKKAAKKASAAQQQAAQQGIDAVSAQNALTQKNFAPYLEAGSKALGAQSDLLGLNGTGVQGSAIDALRASPLFQSLFGNGQEAILNNASATGGLRGGNIQRSLADFGADTLAKTIESQLAALGGLSGQGFNAATNGGQLGAASAEQIAQLLGNKGAAKAGGILGKAAANQELYANLGNLATDVASAFKGMPSGGGFTTQTVGVPSALQGMQVNQSGGAGFQQAGSGLNLAAIAQAFI